jgi:ferric-dicitrate binding protein FerR (iron transport regulator)
MNGIDYDNLIAKHLSGESSAGEDEILFAWLGESWENDRIFQDSVAAFMIAETILPTDRERELTLRSIIGPRTMERRKQHVLYYAAAAIILLVCVFALWPTVMPSSLERLEFQTKAGEVKELALPNGAKVMLNGASTVTYHPADFANTLEVYGEVNINNSVSGKTLSIRYDSIVVRLDKGIINIQNYPERPEKVLTIVSGTIQIKDGRKSDFRFVANEGQTVTSIEGYGILSIVQGTDINFDSWIRKAFAFDRTPLSAVLAEVSKGNELNFILADDQLKNIEVTTVSGYVNYKNFLSELSATLDISFVHTGAREILVRKTN